MDEQVSHVEYDGDGSNESIAGHNRDALRSWMADYSLRRKGNWPAIADLVAQSIKYENQVMHAEHPLMLAAAELDVPDKNALVWMACNTAFNAGADPAEYMQSVGRATGLVPVYLYTRVHAMVPLSLIEQAAFDRLCDTLTPRELVSLTALMWSVLDGLHITVEQFVAIANQVGGR